MLERLTEDHSLLADYRRMGQLSAEQLAAVPKNVITRALGMTEVVEVDTRTEVLAKGDLFLLTSDGVHASLDEARMAELLSAHDDTRAAAWALLGAAKKAGGQDDLTAVLVTTRDDGGPIGG